MTTAESETKPFYKNPWIIAFVLGALTITALQPLQRLFLHAPPALAEVGPWTLTDHRGQPFGSEQLEGKVWVADYFFTRCPSVCPELTRKMKEVQASLGKFEDVRFVSFTVDPEHDTPEKLASYIEKMNIDTSNWTFVTGSLEDVHGLIKKKMFLHIGAKEPIKGSIDPNAKADEVDENGQAELFDISHLARFTLFDQKGDLRATFSTDIEGLGAMGNAARLLIKHGPNP